MSQKISRKPKMDLAQDALSHSRDLLLALSRAAQSVQQAHTTDEIYRAVGDQIKSLGCEVSLLTVNEDRQSLAIVYVSYASDLVRQAEKIIGTSALSFRIAFSNDSIYARNIAAGKAEYVHSAKEHFIDALPTVLRPLAGQLMSILKIEQGILAPLHVEGETLGLMMVSGLALNEGDVPAMESFAGQIAISLHNIHLAQKIQLELAERKQTEAALHSSEAKTHALLDAIPDMMFMLNHEGLFIDYHASKEQLLYAPPESFLGKNIQDVMPPQMVEAYTAKLDQAIQSGKGQLFEYALDMVDGPRHFEAHIVAYQDDNVLCIIRDITRRKKAEEAVEQTRKRFEALIEKAPDGIVLVGSDGSIKYASPSAKRMFDYGTEDSINDNPLELIHPDDLAIALNAMNDLIQNPEYIPTLEYRYKHQDGSYHWLESTFSNLLAEPSVQAVVINFRDITKRKQTEDALRLSEALLNTSQQLSKIGGWEWDVENQSVFWTNETYRIHGFVADEIRSNSMDELKAKSTACYEPKDRPIILAAFQHCVEQGEPYDLELPFTSGTGRKMWIRTTARAVWDEARIVKVIGNIMDITAQKQAEQALRNSENKFHSVVTESADGIALLDEKGCIIEFNNVLEQITGHKREAVLGQSLWDLQFQIIPRQLRTNEYYSQIKGAIQKALETGQSPYFHKIMEVPFEHPNGSVRFIQQRLFSIRTEKGWRIGSISRDITERKQAEDLLEKTRKNYETFFNSIDDFLFVLDETGNILHTNQTVTDRLGYSGEELFGKSVLMVHPPERREEAGRIVGEMLAGTAEFCPVPVMTKSGEQIPVETRVTPGFWDGKPAIFGVTKDISQVKLSEEKFSKAFQSNSALMALSRFEDGTYIDVNDVLLKTLGYSRAEVIGRTSKELHIFADTDQRNKIIEKIKQNRTVKDIEVVAQAKDGSRRDGLFSADTIYIGKDLCLLTVMVDITERKRAEAALQASEAHYHLLADHMTDTIWLMDLNLKFTYVSPSVEKTRGYTLAELQQFSLDQILTPASAQLALELYQVEISKVLADPTYSAVRTVELEFYKRDGGLRSVESKLSIIRDENGNPTYVLGQDRDITERKQAEESLATSEAELRALFASMQDSVLVIDRDGVYRKIAPTNPTLLVRPTEELLGKNLTDIFPAAQAETFLAAIRQVLDTQQSARIEYELSINDRQAWFSTSISPMDPDNTLWVARDVTERKQADAALRESEERYHSLFDRIMDGAYRSTHEGQFVDVNPAMVKMFGYASREEMLAVDIKKELYFAPHERDSHILDDGREEMDIYRMRRKDGSEIWVEDHSSYVHDEQGNITYHEGMLRDITQRKQAEDELRYMKESLESANRELHQFLMQEQVLARTDELTGLFNRRHFFELAEREFSSALRYGRPLAIIMFDADYLKQVNDTFGHTTGDQILMEIGQVAAAQIRAVDVLARYGGDEFILVLPQTNAQQALRIAERICKSAAELRVSTSKGDATVTLSIGVADLLCAPASESIERVIQCADKALYTAKQAGRNRAVMFDLEYH